MVSTYAEYYWTLTGTNTGGTPTAYGLTQWSGRATSPASDVAEKTELSGTKRLGKGAASRLENGR